MYVIRNVMSKDFSNNLSNPIFAFQLNTTTTNLSKTLKLNCNELFKILLCAH